MFITAIVVFSLIGVIQLFVSTLFYIRTKSIKEVSLGLILMSFLPNVSWICYNLLWIYNLIRDTNGIVQGISTTVSKLSLLINFGFLIRMVRVQVQVRAQKESTKKII